MANPRVVLAAPKSGSGKTLITCALIKALLSRGKKVRSYKCGPDYIDPMFHEKILGIPSSNLDLYFADEELVKDIFLYENDAEVSVIEGVMGLYDGLGGITPEASTYHLAKTLKAPVILVVDAHGMGRSVLAEIAGFLSMDTEHLIQGIVLNRMSESFFRTVKPVVEEELKVPVLGYFPVCDDLVLDSRHLGLKLPNEVDELDRKVTLAAELLEQSVDVDALLKIISAEGTRHPVQAPERSLFVSGKTEKRVRIAVAKDEVFCFYYRENLRLLEQAGAELVFFSPLHDMEMPQDVGGLLLGGGYPELKAETLARNYTMLQSVSEAIEKGMPVLAECGGFMYLHEMLVDRDGEAHSMVGAIPGKCFYAGRAVRFGYAKFTDKETGENVKGHEFHYYDSDNNGTAFTAMKPVSGRTWECIHKTNGALQGFAHLYYPSSPDLPVRFVDACEQHKAV